MTDRADRRFWHRFPPDGEWRRVTLASQARFGFRLEPTCRNCWHRGEVMTPGEFAARFDVSMSEPVLSVQARLVCSSCRLPAGYFHVHNPCIPPHQGYPR